MELTPESLALYVGTSPADEGEYLAECIAEAGELVARHCNATDLEAVVAGKKIPPATLTRAVKETAADLFHRRRARNGVVQLDSDGYTGDVVRINADPLRAARPILAPFLGVGIAG